MEEKGAPGQITMSSFSFNGTDQNLCHINAVLHPDTRCRMTLAPQY